MLSLIGLGTLSLLSSCGEESGTTTSVPPLITNATIPDTIDNDESFPVALSVTVPGGLPSGTAFQLKWSNLVVQNITANQITCGIGATSCSTTFSIFSPDNLNPGNYTVTLVVFDVSGQSAAQSRQVTLVD